MFFLASNLGKINNDLNQHQKIAHTSQKRLNASISDEEVNSLQELFTTTGGENWLNINKRWNFPTDSGSLINNDPCGVVDGAIYSELSWYGIECDCCYNCFDIGVSCSVAKLDLSFNNLNGSISASIGSLASLTYLDLSANQLSGSIPNSIGSLTSLSYLGLYGNQLSSSIPDSIGSLADLTDLRLASNLLSGSIPDSIASLTSLTILVLQYNQLSGSIPDRIGSLTSLKLMYSFSNRLSSSIPDSIRSLINLTDIDLNENQLSGSIPDIIGSSLKSLTYLDLSSNQLYGSILADNIIPLTILSHLDLSSNHFSDSIPDIIGSLTNLTFLDLSYNRLSGSIPDGIASLTSLTHFYLSYNRLSGSIPDSTGSMTSLTDLRLSNNRLFGSIPESLIIFTSNPPPRCLGFDDKFVCDLSKASDVASIIGNLVTYTSPLIYQSEHPLHGSFLDGVDSYSISFYERSFSLLTPAPGYFIKIYDSNEVYLEIDGGNVNRALLPGVGNTIPLSIYSKTFTIEYGKLVNLYYNIPIWGWQIMVTGIINSKGWNCSSLTSYTLQDNNNGSLYAVVGQVTKIDLSGLGISGPLSDSFLSMTSLASIDLSNNKFYGDVLGNVVSSDSSNLKSIKFSSNNLNGSLPLQLMELSSLELLDLSNNLFTGEVSANFCGNKNLSSKTSIIANSGLSCYQPCIGGDCNNNKQCFRQLQSLHLCVPTSYPTSYPTDSPSANPTALPTPKPTVFKKQTKKTLLSTSEIVIIAVLGVVLLLLGLYWSWRYFSTMKVKVYIDSQRSAILESLPVHSLIIEFHNSNNKPIDLKLKKSNYISSLVTIDLILESIALHADTLFIHDYDARTAFDLALLSHNGEDKEMIIIQILESSIPSKLSDDINMTDFKNNDAYRCFVSSWLRLVSDDANANIIQTILTRHANLSYNLATVTDEKGYSALDLAGRQKCRKLHGIYEIKTVTPHHQSATCIVHLAVDHSAESEIKPLVALKFMQEKDQFDREIRIRNNANFDEKCVMIILRSHVNQTGSFHFVSNGKRMQLFPYLLVMPAADRNLDQIIDSEGIAVVDWPMIRLCTSAIIHSLGNMHANGYIHGDVKPRNILRSSGRFILTDLDASAAIEKGFSGLKYSTAFIPPELVNMDDKDDQPKIKSASTELLLLMNDSSRDFNEVDLVPAHPAHDAWSLGVTLYLLFTGKNLFPVDISDNIDDDALRDLHSFSQEFKAKKLKIIPDVMARNLISQLLTKDPLQRPSMLRASVHPFLTGKSVARMEVREVVIKSLEAKLVAELDRQGLGSPYSEQLSIESIVNSITVNQGIFIEGDDDSVFDEAVDKIVQGVRGLVSQPLPMPTSQKSTVRLRDVAYRASMKDSNSNSPKTTRVNWNDDSK
eukprot:gene9791-13172_t